MLKSWEMISLWVLSSISLLITAFFIGLLKQEDITILQNDLNTLQEWAKIIKMEFHPENVKLIEFLTN